MNLKKDIVIRNQFSNKYYAKGKSKGSRGGSFDSYIIGYMARDDASDALHPVNFNQVQPFLPDVNASVVLNDRLLGLAGRNVSEVDPFKYYDVYSDDTRVRELKYDGLAFNQNTLSLSYQDTINESTVIQKAFEEGHTAQKLIISFTDDYLIENGILPKDFRLENRGDHFGNVDQLKLRRGIQAGMERMLNQGKFVDPKWIGLVQLDTKHVHAHLVVVDQAFSDLRLKEDGLDRGKVYKLEKDVFRFGCDQTLKALKPMHSFMTQVNMEEKVLENALTLNYLQQMNQAFNQFHEVAFTMESEKTAILSQLKNTVNEASSEKTKTDQLLVNAQQAIEEHVENREDITYDEMLEAWLERSYARYMNQTKTSDEKPIIVPLHLKYRLSQDLMQIHREQALAIFQYLDTEEMDEDSAEGSFLHYVLRRELAYANRYENYQLNRRPVEDKIVESIADGVRNGAVQYEDLVYCLKTKQLPVCLSDYKEVMPYDEYRLQQLGVVNQLSVTGAKNDIQNILDYSKQLVLPDFVVEMLEKEQDQFSEQASIRTNVFRQYQYKDILAETFAEMDLKDVTREILYQKSLNQEYIPNISLESISEQLQDAISVKKTIVEEPAETLISDAPIEIEVQVHQPQVSSVEGGSTEQTIETTDGETKADVAEVSVVEEHVETHQEVTPIYFTDEALQAVDVVNLDQLSIDEAEVEEELPMLEIEEHDFGERHKEKEIDLEL